MTKQQYMNWRISNPINILYQHYISHEKLNHPPLDPQNLVMQLQIKGWNIQKIVSELIAEYDAKFEIAILMDKNGQFIKYV